MQINTIYNDRPVYYTGQLGRVLGYATQPTITALFPVTVPKISLKRFQQC